MNFTNKLKDIFSNTSGATSRPNVIVILLDQFRSDALKTHGVFNKLKSDGVLFSQTITYAPYTLASCHATFTGMYGRDNGVDAYTKSNNYKKSECVTIAEYLRSEGYYTRAYTFSSILIPHAGFDEVKVVHEDDEQGILASHKKEIDECFLKNRPFFSYLHYGEIHHEVVKNVIKKYSIDDKRYFGHFSENQKRYREYAYEAGEYLNSLYDYILQKDKDDNTLIIVMTDHGSSNGEKVGEKAYGSFVYDYSINVWHYWLWPNHFPAGLEVKNQVRTVDILPTLLDVLKIKPKKKYKPIAGASLSSLLHGGDDIMDSRLAFSETGGVDGPYPSPGAANIRCVRDKGWKLIQNTLTNQFELYNIDNDPDEKDNLYGKEISYGDDLLHKLFEFI